MQNTSSTFTLIQHPSAPRRGLVETSRQGRECECLLSGGLGANGFKTPKGRVPLGVNSITAEQGEHQRYGVGPALEGEDHRRQALERDFYIPAQILKAKKNLTNNLPSTFLSDLT